MVLYQQTSSSASFEPWGAWIVRNSSICSLIYGNRLNSRVTLWGTRVQAESLPIMHPGKMLNQQTFSARFIGGTFVDMSYVGNRLYQREKSVCSHDEPWSAKDRDKWKLKKTFRVSEESQTQSNHRTFARLLGWLAVKFPVRKQDNLGHWMNILFQSGVVAATWFSFAVISWIVTYKPSNRNMRLLGVHSRNLDGRK